MDNSHENESNERRNSNTEYLPTKCRITKPPPPKPATNPLQFVKVAPCPLFQKAQEQIKKVEEIKKERKEIREETEDWQQNLDNWKSSRRKRQEHIIERVVEVKKLEQEEQEKTRRKSKTFSEMIEDRSKGRHKFTIPIYDDDSNDLSDYGIGSSSSKTNSIKDVDTDDSSSVLDDKDNHTYDSPSNKDSSVSNQSQSEDELLSTKNEEHFNNNTNNNQKLLNIELNKKESNEQYTYEGAIQDYRSRIQSKIHVDESIFTKNKDIIKSKEYSEAQTVLPKGEIFKRKELFEVEKTTPVDINSYESNSSRRVSEDFANSRSIKERLKSLEKSTDNTAKKIDNKSDIQISVKQRLQTFNKNLQNGNDNNSFKPIPNKISNYLLDKSKSTPNFDIKPTTRTNNNNNWKIETSDRSSSPETELYMNKLNMFNRDLDNLVNNKVASNNIENNLVDDYCNNYPPSTSSVELTGVSSDREDSGIHTADVSCSVSQADEPVDNETDVALNTIPNCIEKLKKEEQQQQQLQNETDNFENSTTIEQTNNNLSQQKQIMEYFTKEQIIHYTTELLDSLRKHSSDNISIQKKIEIKPNTIDNIIVPDKVSKPIIYENIQLKTTPIEFITNDFIIDSTFPLNAPLMEPPKVKPPPPPPPEDDSNKPQPPTTVKRLNSTKRIKKEIHIKRSSFLGLDEPTDDQIDPDILLDKPPDINQFLQKESKLEKSLFKKMQEESRLGSLSKVESQDSGLDIDRGRLSSDTWCSSTCDSTSTPNHERQGSEQTNSITSEEDEITKKEREIIELVEKEEKSRDNGETNNHNDINQIKNNETLLIYEQSQPLFHKNPYYPQQSSDYFDDQDSEVLKVEHELRQLEREEIERQRDNLLFSESRTKARIQNNRHSLENICDDIYPNYQQEYTDYRKSMPELQHIPLDYRKSIQETPNSYYKRSDINDIDLQYRKSMPDIQQQYHKTPIKENVQKLNEINVPIDHRKSMPELQQEIHHRSAFKSPPPPINRQPIMPGKPLRAKDSINFNQDNYPRQLSKHSLQALSAVPRNKYVPNDNWIQPKANPEVKSYNQHWVFQEAELRRISDQQKNASTNKNWPQSSSRQEKPLPDSIIQSLTQRVQIRANLNDRNQQMRRSDNNSVKQQEYIQHSYLNHSQTMGHALPMPYAPPIIMEESQDRMLSVSGKKKCSYCGNELGRGAAMIIESLCLFYHMECFKCCVCHMQLGNGLMGTDVRVRNQKLHCHNCYSSDDGVKFSCV